MKRLWQDSERRAAVRAVTRAIYFRDTAALVTAAFVVLALVAICIVVVFVAIGVVEITFGLLALITTGGVSVFGMLMAFHVFRAIGKSIDAFKDETKSPAVRPRR